MMLKWQEAFKMPPMRQKVLEQLVKHLTQSVVFKKTLWSFFLHDPEAGQEYVSKLEKIVQ